MRTSRLDNYSKAMFSCLMVRRWSAAEQLPFEKEWQGLADTGKTFCSVTLDCHNGFGLLFSAGNCLMALWHFSWHTM